MKKIALVGLLSGVLAFNSQAQVKDISVTVAPTAEYMWWDNDTMLKDGTFVGGRVGFGFGRYFEVRGLYMKTLDLKGTLDNTNLNYDSSPLAKDIQDMKVDVTRIGGEVKANIGLSNKFAPYITLGTGVQKFKFDRENQKLDEYKEKQIYATAGLGVKVNLSDRMVLALEGRNTVFNINENNQYVKPDIEKDGESNRLYNWSALASLEFYLGGRKPNEMTDLDKAYRDSFRGGMSKAKFSVEPSGMYIDFDDESIYSDSYFLGAGVGVDFSDYVGIRGFYYQATKDREFKLKPDNSLQIYGGNVIARLHNNLTGVAPYLSLGGGYINPADDYVNEEGHKVEDGSAFAMGGLGLEIPLSRNILAYGSANYMMTTSNGSDAEDVSAPDELHSNVAYRVGVRFQLGSRTKNPNDILATRSAAQQNEMSELKAEYEKRIEKLNEKLEEAYANNDVDKAVTILEERKRNEQELRYAEGINSEQEDTVRMSRSEFEDLVDEVVRKVDRNNPAYEYERINQLENALLQVNENTPVATTKGQVDDANKEILKELRELNKKVDRNTDMITKSLGTSNNNNTPSRIVKETKTTINNTENGREVKEVTETRKADSFLKMPSEGFSAFMGPNFGEDFSWNIGLRAYYPLKNNKNLEFMPEVYLGFGNGTDFGLSGNMLYQFNGKGKGKVVNPYVGAGLGVFKHDGTDFGVNLIVGTELDILDGKLFVDYSSRNFFDNNQIAVGYRFTF